MSQFFAPPPKLNPTIYAYEFVNVPSHQGYLKIGYTEREPRSEERRVGKECM